VSSVRHPRSRAGYRLGPLPLYPHKSSDFSKLTFTEHQQARCNDLLAHSLLMVSREHGGGREACCVEGVVSNGNNNGKPTISHQQFQLGGLEHITHVQKGRRTSRQGRVSPGQTEVSCWSYRSLQDALRLYDRFEPNNAQLWVQTTPTNANENEQPRLEEQRLALVWLGRAGCNASTKERGAIRRLRPLPRESNHLLDEQEHETKS